jgi:hypothetical protein
MRSLSREEARRLVLAATGLARGPRRDGSASWRRLGGVIDRLNLLQMDSVNVLVRAHYLPLYSRAGPYDPAVLDARAFDNRRRALFEYWAHEASLLPFALHPLLRWRMADAARGQGIYKDLAAFAREKRGYVGDLLKRVREEGPASARDLGDPGGRTGPWWGWHDAKIALEYLFWAGEVTAAGRRGFERVYDVPERVIPAEVLSLPSPPRAEAIRRLVALSAEALGVATEADLRDYFRLGVADCRRAIAELVQEGALLPVTVEGWRQEAFMPAGAEVPARAAPTTLVSPFDPLVWNRARAERVFGFSYRIEIYTPAEKRTFGYYVLPFIHRGRFVARACLKADRGEGVLKVNAAHGEPGIKAGPVGEALGAELSAMARWLGLERVEVAANGNLSAAIALR